LALIFTLFSFTRWGAGVHNRFSLFLPFVYGKGKPFPVRALIMSFSSTPFHAGLGTHSPLTKNGILSSLCEDPFFRFLKVPPRHLWQIFSPFLPSLLSARPFGHAVYFSFFRRRDSFCHVPPNGFFPFMPGDLFSPPLRDSTWTVLSPSWPLQIPFFFLKKTELPPTVPLGLEDRIPLSPSLLEKLTRDFLSPLSGENPTEGIELPPFHPFRLDIDVPLLPKWLAIDPHIKIFLVAPFPPFFFTFRYRGMIPSWIPRFNGGTS